MTITTAQSSGWCVACDRRIQPGHWITTTPGGPAHAECATGATNPKET